MFVIDGKFLLIVELIYELRIGILESLDLFTLNKNCPLHAADLISHGACFKKQPISFELHFLICILNVLEIIPNFLLFNGHFVQQRFVVIQILGQKSHLM